MIQILIADDDKEKWIGAFCAEFKRRCPEAQFRHVKTLNACIKFLDDHRTFDLVLLDIEDMGDWEKTLEILKIRWPELPVVLLSKQEIAQITRSAFDLGAQSFLFKQELGLNATSPYPTESQRIQDAWDKAIRKLRKICQDYQPIKRLLSNSRDIGRVKKSGLIGKSIVQEQVDFLRNVSQIEGLKDHFPPVHNSYEKKTPEGSILTYEMPWYRAKSLRRVLLEQETSEGFFDIGSTVLKRSLHILSRNLYSHGINTEFDSDFQRTVFIKKFEDRKLETSKDLYALLGKESSPYLDWFRKVFEAEEVIIAGKKLISPSTIISELATNSAILDSLRPPRLCWIHGDLHFDNILIDPFRETGFLKFIDPRGFQEGGDIAYDLGKLLHSCHGLYDLIHEGHLFVEFNNMRSHSKDKVVEVPELKFSEWADKSITTGGSKDHLTVWEQCIHPGIIEYFNELSTYLISTLIPHLGQELNDEKILERALFNEAMHFCTMAPFHIYKDVRRTLAIYLRGIELLNNAYYPQ